MATEQEEKPAALSAAELQRIYALDRTVLANERTYAAWIRTGLAAMVGGMAVEHVLFEIYPDWVTRSIAFILILFSAAAFLLGSWRYAHLGIKLDSMDVKAIPTRVTTGVGLFLAACSVIALIGRLLIDL